MEHTQNSQKDYRLCRSTSYCWHKYFLILILHVYRLFIAHSDIFDACSLCSHGHLNDRNTNNPKHVLYFLQKKRKKCYLTKNIRFCEQCAKSGYSLNFETSTSVQGTSLLLLLLKSLLLEPLTTRQWAALLSRPPWLVIFTYKRYKFCQT